MLFQPAVNQILSEFILFGKRHRSTFYNMSSITAVFRCLFLISLEFYFCTARTILVGTDNKQPEGLMNRMETEALFEVMQVIAGNTDWRTVHPHPCSEDIWPGLLCEQGDDGLFHVTRLDFGYRPNPPCKANASIPTALANLSFLQCLFIFECFTSSKIKIPPELGQLAPSLQQLSLRGNNALVGEIPPQLGSLIGLEVLSLSQNSLEGKIPPQLGQLNNLQHLDLSYNKFSGEVPDELDKLKKLVILDLSFNSLEGRIPSSLGKLTMLKKIDLSSNFLHGTLPPELGSLTNLEFLAVSDNFIQGPFPNTLSNLTDLQYLIMNNDPMNVPLPKFLGTFRKMQVLTLSNSGYVGTIPDELCQLANLTVLSLDRNNLTGSIPIGLGNLLHIYELNLSENMLIGPIPFSPGFVRSLGKNLNLKGNAGLCSPWTFPQDSQGANVHLCTDPSKKGYLSYLSSASSRLHGSSKDRNLDVKSAIFCIASLQLLGAGRW